MWLIGAVLVIGATLVISLLIHDFLVVASAILLYFLYVVYVDDGPITGYRTNYALRKARWLWSWPRLNPLKLIIPTGLTFAPPETAQYIFVVLPNRNNSALFWTFGVYGGHAWRDVADTLRMCYIMPAILFYIPLLRELLMATGAVASGEGVLQRQISLGRNVAYAPYGMGDVLLEPGQVLAPPAELFDVVTRTTSLYIVPVVVRDDDVCFLQSHPRLRALQRQTFAWFQYPWPCIWAPRKAPGHVRVNIGPPMLGADYQGRAEDMAAEFQRAALAIYNVHHDAHGPDWTWRFPQSILSESGPKNK